MNRSYWTEIVAKLFLPDTCVWAAHVLASDMSPSGVENTNLARAVEATSSKEIIEGVLTAYQDWSAQPKCDLILRHFGELVVPAAMRAIESTEPNVRRGALGALYHVDPKIARDAARSLEARKTNADVQRDIEWFLNQEQP